MPPLDQTLHRTEGRGTTEDSVVAEKRRIAVLFFLFYFHTRGNLLEDCFTPEFSGVSLAEGTKW